MVVAMAVFAGNDACVKAATEVLPVSQAILIRGLLTLAFLGLIARVRGGVRLQLQGRDRRVMALRLTGEVASTLFYLPALHFMPLANLAAIMQSLPLVVTLLAAAIFGERIGWRRSLAIGTGFVGMLLILRPGAAGFDLWALAGLAAMVSVALRDLSTRCLSAGVSSLAIAIYAAAGVTLLGVAGAPLEGWRPVGGREALLLLGAAACLVVGYLCVVGATRVGEVGHVAPFRYTSLVFSVLLGWAAFAEIPDAATAAGALVVVASGLFTLHRSRRLARAPR